MAKEQQEKSNVKKKAKGVTPKFRAAHVHLFKASAMPGTNNEPSYSITMLIDKKSDKSFYTKLIDLAKTNLFGPNKAKWPKVAAPWQDGDLAKYAKYEGYKGHYAIKASTAEQYGKPTVLDSDGETELTTPSEIYPGCYARAAVMATVWEFPKGSGKFGVSFILDHVQKLSDGKAFGGKTPANQVFSPVHDEDEDDSFTNDEDSDIDSADEDSEENSYF